MSASHTPFAVLNRTGNPVMKAVLRSPVHRLFSGQMTLITVTGRRSGRAYTIPVGYRPLELARALASYLAAALRRGQEVETFEDWVSSRFGRRLYEMFFRSYTEKVWGVPCNELRAEWAAQRIRGLSFVSAARAGLFGHSGSEIKSLIGEFYYPRLGPGQMWEAMQRQIEGWGGEVRLQAPVERLLLEDGRIKEVVAGGATRKPDAVISSLPLNAIADLVDPSAPPEVLTALRGLRYRDFLTVALVLDGDDPFPDNWIYVHDPSVRVARIQNYRSWSPAMVPDDATASVGLEYFCFRGDDLWSMEDSALVALAASELARLGLGRGAEVRCGHVVRVPQAYPIYDAGYADRLKVIRRWLAGIENLQQVGRNGLHRYNNSDHSMLTAMCAVENLRGARHDLWSINTDSGYGETLIADEQPYLPRSRAVVADA